MDLVERYMAAIRRNLPKAKANDIAAEIAEDLQSRREDREEALGRPLTREETTAMLRSFGHPLVVAGRFRPHQYLIRPEVYPFFLFVMKIVLAAVVALVAGITVVNLVLGTGDFVRAVVQAIGDLLSFLLFTVALVTLIFAMLERAGFPAEHVAKWTPEQLPDPLDKPQSQWESAFEAGLGLALLLWWTGVVDLPRFISGEIPIQAALIWDLYYLPILLLLAAQLVISLMKWLRPRWKRAAGILTIVTSVATLALVIELMKAGSWVVPAAGVHPGIVDSVNLAIKITLVVVAVMMTLQALGELWKLIGRRTVA